MKKTIRRAFAWGLVLLLLFPALAVFADEFPKTGKVGVLLGGILDVFCEDVVPGSTPEYFYAAADMPLALESGKIDAYIDDELSAISHCQTYHNIRIDKVVYSDHYGFIFNKNNEALRNQMSEYIFGLRESGELAELKKIWIDGQDESKQKVDYEDLPAENGTLNIAIAATMPPMIYVKDGKYAGYEVAVLAGFCREYGYGVKFSDSDFSSVLAGVTSGVSDIGAASISITEERKKSMLYSESHVESYSVSVVRKNDGDAPLTAEDYAKSRLGVLEGSIHLRTAEKFFPDAMVDQYSTYADIGDALARNRIDAYIMDEPQALRQIKEHGDQTILTTLEPFSYAYALPKNKAGSAVLQEQLDNYISGLKESNELKEITDRWLSGSGTQKTVDLEKLKKNSKMLTVAVFVSNDDPFIYKKDGKYGGFEVELLVGFCEEYGYDLDINEYSFDDMLLAVANGKCDVAAGTLSVTEERKEKYLFSAPTYEGGNVLVVNKTDGKIDEGNFFTRIGDSFQKTFIQESRWRLFVRGIATTVLVSALSILCGTLLAYAFSMLYYKKYRVLNKVIDFFCELVEKTPAVVILMILYYIVFGRLYMSAVIVAAIGLSMKFSVHVFGLFCIGVGSIGKGQTEAALALSYPPRKVFTHIVFPQAVMRIISGYKSAVVNLIEETAVVGYIAVEDLTKISDIIRSRTYEAFFPLLASAVIYILIAVLLVTVVKKIEFRIDPKKRKEADILRGIER